ncbi:HAD family hydrolase [Hymenobacter cheonanensis]|uniref:HAD family hydrolase n=1 Tax=Hymenobacter sp. CA2-7 TaxID=3063993 RepID=UPI002713C54A|nr:HAD family phosphatase [Hymenobacter sp. CA2-7]MDO7884714.1 HAD family phosphatase [Hymenobacter sp. CA2-7]
MPDLQALIFDMDGVLVDNTPVQARAFQLFFRDQGLPVDATQLLRRLNGAPAAEILKEAFGDEPQPADKLEAFASQREFLYRTLYWDDRRPLPGLVDFLEAARAAGLKIGLGTGSGQETISYILDELNLRRFFDVVITKDDVDQGKPHADTYAVTAKKLGVKPENCVVFEDALLGEQAAYRAHMHCVAVASTLPGRDFQAPLLVIRDFTELTPASLRTAFEAVGAAPRPDKGRA